MSDHDRRKKDGRDKNKDMQAMREVERDRHEDLPQNRDNPHDEQDHVTYKPGSAGDRSQRGAR